MSNQKVSQSYCELCGSPIRGKEITVIYEGSVITICSSCYTKIKKYAKPYDEKKSIKLGKITEKAITIVKKSNETELEIVDDYYRIIKAAREKMGLSTKQLAEKLKVSENIIKRFEQGKLKPTIEQAKALEKILSIKLLVPVSSSEEIKLNSKNYDLTLGDIVNFRDEKK